MQCQRNGEKFTRFLEGLLTLIDLGAGQVQGVRGFLLFGTLHAWE
jgi:hypothetical protein